MGSNLKSFNMVSNSVLLTKLAQDEVVKAKRDDLIVPAGQKAVGSVNRRDEVKEAHCQAWCNPGSVHLVPWSSSYL